MDRGPAKSLLPIDAVITPLIDALRGHSSVVVKAPAGSGKTTRVPISLIDRGLVDTGTVVVVQPRRVAARTVARRIADERGGRVGDEIGYHIRFDRQVSSKTRLVVMTEGVLLRRLQEDPFLDGIAAVVLDEFHERHLETDLCLAMVRRVQQTVRPDLLLLVMSATLAAEPIAAYLGQCPIIQCDGSTFPVQIRYQEIPSRSTLGLAVTRGVEEMLRETSGDVLVFLPGVREIRQVESDLQNASLPTDSVILPLYGDLPASEQDRAFETSTRRKIILATNVAETSITIPGITAVVDTGTARVLSFDANLGLNRLELLPISRASADQRAGRAGRTGPGVCVRLWPEQAHRHRPERELPEIHRADLSGVLLQLLDWGEIDATAFPWFEQPDPGAIERGNELLLRLGASNSAGITPLGRQMVCLPVVPRLARLILAVAESGQLNTGAIIASLLTERDPFVRDDRRGLARHRSRSDILDRADAIQEYSRTRRTSFDLGNLNRGAADYVLQAANQLKRQTVEVLGIKRPDERGTDEEAILKAILAAFPDRLVRRRQPGGRRGLMVGGRGVRLADQSAVTEGDLFVCVEGDAGPAEMLVRQASFVDRQWLSGDNLQIRVDVEFDADHERVQARRRVCWDGLVLEESPTGLPDDDQTAVVLVKAALAAWDRVFPTDNLELCSYLARVRCLARWMPDLGLPDFDEPFLQGLLPSVCMGMRSFAEIRGGDWLSLIRSRLTASQNQLVEREAPERIQVPSGSRVAIQYDPDRPPILAVRIQEIFGWKNTPRIAGGRVPLLLHLLAPNHRPQQITDDLASFWNNAYPIIRGELRRRYPRHAWPEDPWNALPERRPQSKRRDG